MRRVVRHRPTPAMIVALIALFVAMSGASYAALARNTVGPKQLIRNAVTPPKIKKKAVTRAKIRPNAINSSRVQDGSLRAADFGAGQVPAGPTGATGPAGTALAYARVGADGTLDPGTPPQNKGVAQANVEHDGTTGEGVYCFGGLGFTPTSAIVTVDSAMALTTSNQIAAVAVQRGNVLGNCDETHQQARVSLLLVSNAEAPKLVNHGFTIWFEGQ